MAEMDDITRDALRRANQMHNRAPRQAKTPPARQNEPEQKAKTSDKPKQTQPDRGLLGTLFKDQDKSIILMLLVLLMGEDVEPSLLIALVYLLL